NIVVFFFQAEDGIRDLIVTGVQTCALPILVHAAAIAPSGDIVVTAGATDAIRAWDLGTHKKIAELEAREGETSAIAISRDGHWRSEERRVGKECRVRGAAEE